MKEKERLDKIAELKSEMRNMLDKAAAEKRALTDDEKASFNALKDEQEMHVRYFQANEVTPEIKPAPVDLRSVFAENVCKAVAGGKRTEIDLRVASAPIDATDVADTIPILYKDVLEALTPNLIIEQLGIQMQTNVQGEPLWPTLAGVEATIEGENAEVADKTLEFGKIKSSPKRLSVSIPVSRRAFNQSNLALYNIVVSQIGKAVAKTLNKWYLQNTAGAISGTTVAPFRKAAADVDFAVDGKPTFAEIVALETKVLNANVDATGTGAYLISPNMAGYLKSTPVESGNTKMIFEGGEINGYKVIVTNLVPAGHVYFGFFDYSVIAEFGTSQLIVDPYTGAKKNTVNFVLNGDFDVVVLRPEAFAVGVYVA